MTIKVFCDGGARGNPGPAACAFVAYKFPSGPQGELLKKFGKYLGVGTNNEAEYWAVIEAWRWIKGNLANWPDVANLNVDFNLDSNLVVNQISGKFRVKEPRLRGLLDRVREEEGSLRANASYIYVPREKNFEADLLVNETLDREIKG